MEYWIWLTQLKGIGYVLQKRLLEHFKDPLNIYNANEEQLLSVKGIGKSLATTIKESKCLVEVNSVLSNIHKKDIKLLTYNDRLYPNIAKKFDDSPILLYYRGTIRENIEGVAIVGARRCSDYGKQIAIDAANYLSSMNIAVISGMAKGIDSYAHTACINASGYTIAFLGNGLDICYPKEHIDLMEAIIKKGAVVSQFPPGTPPKPTNFPKRNSLISSWSEKILVAEASEKSGSLITADIAKNQGKEVFIAPHEIYSILGKGNNKLLLKGASLYLSPKQLTSKSDNYKCEIKDFFIKQDEKLIEEHDSVKLTVLEEQILSSISEDIKTIEEINKDVKIGEVNLLQQLSIMEITGLIKCLPGGRFVKNA